MRALFASDDQVAGRSQHLRSGGPRTGSGRQNTDPQHFGRLLRARRERPNHRHAKGGYQFSALHPRSAYQAERYHAASMRSHAWAGLGILVSPLRPPWVQSRLGGASCRSNHVRNAPLATVGPNKAACRDGPVADISLVSALQLAAFEVSTL